MGSFRTGLILALFTATPVMAEVCEALRPNWSPADGPVSALSEALDMLLEPWPLVTIGILALAAFTGRALLAHIGLALAVSMSAVLVFIPLAHSDPIYEIARSEGCIGPSYLRYILAGLILIGAMVVLARDWHANQE